MKTNRFYSKSLILVVLVLASLLLSSLPALNAGSGQGGISNIPVNWSPSCTGSKCQWFIHNAEPNVIQGAISRVPVDWFPVCSGNKCQWYYQPAQIADLS